MTPPVRVRELRFRYAGGDRDVLRIPALDIATTGLVAVTGSSGAGKTTLMELLAGTLRETYDGSIRVLGAELRDLRRDADRQRHLRRVGLVPQDLGLLPGCTVRDILHQDLADAQVPLTEHEARVERALERVGLLSLADRSSEQLSGGQRQRIAIARTLARDVELMIADEPTANLDRAVADGVMALFRELGADRPVVIVTHDPTVAARCDRVISLQPVTEAGSPAPPSGRSPSAAPVERRRHAASVAGMLALVLATAASVLAVQATNSRSTSAPRPGSLAVRPRGDLPAVRDPRLAAPVPAGAQPRVLAKAGAPPQAAAPVVEVVRIVEPTPPARMLPAAEAPAPSAPPAAAPPAYVEIDGRHQTVCATGTCQDGLVHVDP
jgi:putative ABC transport system ATP-binding protein